MNEQLEMYAYIVFYFVSGLPLVEPNLTVTSDGGVYEVLSPGAHEMLLIDSDTVTLTSTIQTEFDIKFIINGQNFWPRCKLAEPRCRHDQICTLTKEWKLEQRYTLIVLNLTLHSQNSWHFYVFEVKVGK